MFVWKWWVTSLLYLMWCYFVWLILWETVLFFRFVTFVSFRFVTFDLVIFVWKWVSSYLMLLWICVLVWLFKIIVFLQTIRTTVHKLVLYCYSLKFYTVVFTFIQLPRHYSINLWALFDFNYWSVLYLLGHIKRRMNRGANWNLERLIPVLTLFYQFFYFVLHSTNILFTMALIIMNRWFLIDLFQLTVLHHTVLVNILYHWSYNGQLERRKYVPPRVTHSITL